MGPDDKTSIELTAKAEIREVVAWTNTLNAATDALMRYQSVAAMVGASGVAAPEDIAAPSNAGGGGVSRPSGAPPPTPSPIQPPPSSAPPGGGDGPAAARFGQAGRTGLGFLGTAASTALGVGLGTSLTGMVLAAPQRFMALDTVLTQLSRRFREADENAGMFGRTLGYTISETAMLADSLGSQTNGISRRSFEAYGGFARFTGVDPGAAMNAFGTSQRLTGQPLTDERLAELLQLAARRDMDQGRLQEYLSSFQQTIEQMFSATGGVAMPAALAAMNLPGMVYGENDPRRHSDRTLTQGLNATLGEQGMQTYLMRAMGFGREGGPSYIEMRKRLDAGIYDPQNLVDLFGSFQERGMSEGQMFRALEGSAGGNLKAHQIEAIVGALGSEAGLLRYGVAATYAGEDTSRSTAALDEFTAGLTDSQRKQFEGGGFFGLTGVGISTGESVEVKLEKIYMDVGRPIAEAVPSIVGTVESILGVLGNVSGVDWGETIPDMARNIHKMALLAEKVSGIGLPDVAGRSFNLPNLQDHMGPIDWQHEREIALEQRAKDNEWIRQQWQSFSQWAGWGNSDPARAGGGP